MSIYAYIVAAVLLLATGTGVGIKWEKGREAIRQIEAKEIAAEQRRQNEHGIDVAAVSHEKAKRELATEFVVITERIEDARQTDFYSAGNLCLDDTGLRIVASAARAASAAASKPAGVLPRHSSAP
jgi:hypothetical protein